MRDIAGEIRTNSYATFSYGPLHMDEQILNNQQEPIHKSSIRRQDVV